MEIIDNKVVLIRTQNPDKYSIIPRSKIVERFDGGGTVAVYYGLEETRVLRNMGVKKLRSPITARYEWPGRYKPMAHQIETASFATLHKRAFIFNEPGTAKTISVLWAADYLMRVRAIRRVLVVCPVSIMHSAWMGDITNSVIHRSAVVAHHSQAKRRKELIRGEYEIVITNYEGIAMLADDIRRDGRFDLVIVDEANAYKNPRTQRWKALNSILTKDTWLWMMTGTPAAQSPEDAYGLAKLVCPQNVPAFFTGWRDKVMLKVSNFRWVPKKEARDLVFQALQPAIRFTKKQCLDLPPVMTETREVPMTPQQAKYYKQIKEQMLVMAAGATISAVNKGVLVNKLLQISAGAAYTDEQEVVVFDSSPRLRVVEEIMEETTRKVIVFALHRSSMDTLAEHLTGKGYKVAQIHGDVAPRRRADIINAFQHSDTVEVLVMQPQATAHGITLVAADTVVFYGPIPSVELYLQCIARADRQGQTSDSVKVIHIQSSPTEARAFKAMTSHVEDHALLTALFDSEADDKGGLNMH